MSAKYFDIRIDGGQLQKDIAQINRQIGLISKNMQKEGQEIDAITSQIGQGLAGAFSVFTAGKFIKDIASVRGEFQQLEVAFETMLGSREKADKLMQEVVQFAARTPFELQDVASGTKQLLAFGVEADKVIPTLKAMGDVSAGLSVPIERLITNFGQVRTQTKMTGRELRDFQMAGVPVVAELAKNMNVSEQAIADMVTAGKIGFKEVEEAFITMTSEGGRFSNLMEEQAKTITGLASNFADAWDRMLNSIGKENQGIIAGSIQGAITLVENYEEVLKVLKLIIATYGTYKAAVIAAAAVQSSAAVMGNVRAWFELARGIRSAKDAQIAFNLATRANPYAFIAAAIASLVAALIIFRKETKNTQDYIEELNGSIESIGKQIEVDTLINRYIDLQDKTGKTKEEQAELNKTVAELGRLFPSLVSQTDKYGTALDLTRDKVIQLNEELRENARISTQKQVADAQDLLNQKIAERDRLLKEANSGQAQAFDSMGQQTPVVVELIPKAIEERRKKVEELNAEIVNLSESIGKSEEKLQQLGSIDAAKILEPYRQLFGNVETYSREQALKIKAELTKLLGLGLGKDAENMIKSEIDKIATELALPTIKDQIRQVVADLKNAENQLAQLRAPGSRATPDNISDKEDEIKNLQKKYEALTGINKKEAEKAIQEQKKEQKERLDAMSEFHQQQLILERQLAVSKVALMQQGADRRKEEAELEYKDELDRIEKQQQAYIEAWNATKGLKPGEVGFISELPEDELLRFTNLRVNAELQKNQKIEQINKETSERMKEIWALATEFFLTQQEKEIRAISERYDILISEAQKSGQIDLAAQLQKTKNAEIENINKEYEISRLDSEQRLNEALFQFSNEEILFNKKKYLTLLNMALTFEREKLDILKSKEGVTDQEIKESESRINSIEKTIKEFKKASSQELVSMITDVTGFLGEYNEIFKGISSISSGIGKVMAGDITGMFQVFKGITQLFEQQGKKEEERYKAMVEAMNSYIDNIDLQFEMIGRSIERAFGEDKLNGFKKGIQSIGKDLTWAITEINRLAKVTLALPDKDAIIGYSGPSTSGSGNTRPGGQPIFGYSIDGIERAIAENEKRINKLTLEYERTGDDRVKQVLDAYQKWVGELYNLKDTYMELLTGTTPGGIADAIVQGFQQGKRSAQDFADDFEEMIKMALISAMKIRVLEAPLTEFYAQFAEAMDDGILTKEERIQLRETYDRILDLAKQWGDGIQETLGFDPFGTDTQQQKGMAGQIKGITEETASMFVGQFYAMREIDQKMYDLMVAGKPLTEEMLDYNKQMADIQQKSFMTGLEQLDVLNQSVTHLAEIASNTRHNQKLVSIDKRLEDMNNYLKAVV